MGSWQLRTTQTSVICAFVVGSAAAVAMAPYGEWSAPARLDTLPDSSNTLNTGAVDGCASQSSDGLTLYFNSNRGGNHDLYVATRGSRSDGFGTPSALPSPVNMASDEFCPTIAQGGKLYFSSTRDDPSAGDIYVTRKGPHGWAVPTPLGSGINTPGSMEESADFYEDGGHEIMVFSRRDPSGANGKIYESVAGAPATLVAGGPHSSASDNRPSVTHDGRTMFFDSTRAGTLGGPDIYYSTRSSTSQPWGTAVQLTALSSAGFDARAYISWDGTMLTFSSARASNVSPAPDMWFATRAKTSGR